jgi:hypothetical protein
MKAGGCLGYVSRKDRITVRAGHGVLSAGLSEAATVTQTARSQTRTPEPAAEGGLEKRTGRAKDGTRARKGKGIRVSQARVTKVIGGEAGGRRLGGGHATQGERASGVHTSGPTGNPTSPEFDRRARAAPEAGPRQSIRGKAMDWRTCSPDKVGAEAAQSLDGRGRGSKPSTTRITHRIDLSRAP